MALHKKWLQHQDSIIGQKIKEARTTEITPERLEYCQKLIDSISNHTAAVSKTCMIKTPLYEQPGCRN